MKNFNIVKSISIISVISILALAIIGIISYSNTKQMYQKTNNMYSEVIPKLKDWGMINNDISMLRGTLTKIIDRPYDKSNFDTMLSLNDDINNLINENIKIAETDKEKEIMLDAQKAYQHYYSYIPDIMSQREKDLIPDIKIANTDMAKYGKDMSETINTVVDYEQSLAKNQRDNTELLYKNSIKYFGIVFFVMLMILVIISLFIITSIKKSIKEFTQKLKRLSYCDFNINFDLLKPANL